MARKAKTSKNRKVNKKGRTRPAVRYSPALADQVKVLIEEFGAVNSRGEIAWVKIARVIGVSKTQIYEWRKASSPHYKPQFAAACEQAVEVVESGRIKRGLIELAKPHAVIERTRLLKRIGPAVPPKSWTKAALAEYARVKMGLTLDADSMSKGEMHLAVEAECEKRTVSKMVTVKERRRTEVDVKAASMVLPNIGPPEKRWMVKEGRVHDATGELARLLEEIAQGETVLPRYELTPADEQHDREGTVEQSQKPPVAAQ